MSKQNLSSGLVVLWVLSFLTACQTVPYQGQARDVKKKAEQGGVLAVPLNARAEDRQVAEEKMKATCGSLPYKIVEESEAVVGTKSVQSGRSTNRDDSRRDEGQFLGMRVMSGEAGGADTKTESSTEAIKEWQISYECMKSSSAKK